MTLALAGALALMATPAAALGADLYVDAETGSNANPCSQAAPCQSVTQALTVSAASDTIRIDSGTYLEQVSLGNGRSLDFQDFVAADGTSPAILDGGAGTAVTVVSAAGRISDLVIRGNVAGVQLNDAAELAGNSFDDPDADNAIGVNAAPNVTGISIHDNAFTDPAPSATRGRAGIQAQFDDFEIRDNTFSGMNIGIIASAGAGASVIEGNEFTGTHNLPGQGRSISGGGGAGGTLVIRENTLSDAVTDDVVYGIMLSGAATLVRNEVSGHTIGVQVPPEVTGVTLEGDLLYDGAGLTVSDLNTTPPRSEATLTNVTVADAAIFNDGGNLTIDSSIVNSVFPSPTATCTITFSRADSAGTDPTGCDGFTTTADPQFVNAAAGNFHLSPGSPMIDAGNPAAPALGAVDYDGDPRALDATPECSGNVERRDIGADEWAPVTPDCEAPETTLTKTPKRKGTKRKAKFEFESDEPVDAAFMCKLDGAPYAACSSPLVWPVSVGKHTFRVYAIDAAANEDPTAAKYRFKRRRR